MNTSEDLVAKLFVDVLAKKVTLYGVDGAILKFKCGTINEFVELIDKCKKLLKTDQVICR